MIYDNLQSNLLFPSLLPYSLFLGNVVEVNIALASAVLEFLFKKSLDFNSWLIGTQKVIPSANW